MDVIVVCILIVIVFMAITPFKRYLFKRKWRAIEKEQLNQKQRELLIGAFPPYNVLNEQERLRLERKILYFLKYKKFWPLHDFIITEEMKLLVAAQACILVLNLDQDIYPSLVNIYISQFPFVEKENQLDTRTALPAHVPRLGESWQGGPVVLAWSAIAEGISNWSDGHNVVFHEFAHQLDGLDGGMDGTPPLKGEKALNKWAFFMSKDFLQLRQAVASGYKSDIDPYGATNEAEFFAVTVEEFFERPHIFKAHHHEIYELYRNFFKLDPSRWEHG